VAAETAANPDVWPGRARQPCRRKQAELQKRKPGRGADQAKDPAGLATDRQGK
jgi:hypothetical protein